MRLAILLTTFFFAACAADSTPSAGLSNQEDVSVSPDLQGSDDTGGEAEDVAEADTCWWCEDAGPMDTNDPGLQDGVDPSCYEGCIAKGQEEQFCADYCSKAGGKDDDGKGDDGKGDAGNLTEEECYEGCIAKGASEDECAAYCSDAFGDGKGDGGKGDGGKGDDGKGDGDNAAEKECYEGCIAKGESPEVCAEYCADAFGDGKGDDDGKDDDGKDDEDEEDDGGDGAMDEACFAACIEKGQDEQFCADYCGNAADKGDDDDGNGDDGKDGDDDEDDDDQANVDQACYDACIEKGQPEDVCLAACAEGADGK